MSFNKFMHPNNMYRNPPNFKHLSIKYPEFRKYVTQDLSGKIRIDFKDPDCLRALTTVLLKNDFELDVEIPPNHLIPTLPQRLNYILWIEDLLGILPRTEDGATGIDIGTGSCCIYPLLGSKTKNWKFLATDVNDSSLQWAIKNIQKNNLDDKIKVVKVDANTILKEVIGPVDEVFDFTMCNPPFFHEEGESFSRTPRRALPKSSNTATSTEKQIEGGEVEFVKRMIDDSLVLKEKVKIYTTMLGKKHSFQIIKNELKKYDMIHFTTSEFCQGNTMRWGIAWTFLRSVQLKQVPMLKHQKHKPPIVYLIPQNKSKYKYCVEDILPIIINQLIEIKVVYQIVNKSKNKAHMHIKAQENTWSHQRRKRRELLRQQKSSIESSPSENNTIKTNDDILVPEQQDGDKNKEESMNDDDNSEAPMETEDMEIDNSVVTHTDDKRLGSDADTDSDISNKNVNILKRERSELNSLDVSKFKRIKLDESTEDENKNEQNSCDFNELYTDSSEENFDKYILWCDLSLKRGGKNIFLYMQCPDEMNREPMHQVLQFLKNKLQQQD